MPKVIGVITSPTGAVIRDILHRISDRFPVHVIVWPVRVQGETSGKEVANGIHRLNTLPEDGPIPRPDLIIVARGGGSLEDLWGFNDEVLVRAAADSMIPLISAVGHETDWTLIDHAADWRAPTPTAAAEKAVPVKADLEATLADLGARLRGAVSRLSDKRRNDLRSAARGIRSADQLLAMPRRQFDEAAGRLGRGLERNVQMARGRFDRAAAAVSPMRLHDRTRIMAERFAPLRDRHRRVLETVVRQKREHLTARLQRLRLEPLALRLTQAGTRLTQSARQLDARFSDRVSRERGRLDTSASLLKSLSYTGVLERGYAVIRDADDVPVRGVSSLRTGDAFVVQMQDGRLDALAQSAGPKAQKTKKKARETSQGDLF